MLLALQKEERDLSASMTAKDQDLGLFLFSFLQTGFQVLLVIYSIHLGWYIQFEKICYLREVVEDFLKLSEKMYLFDLQAFLDYRGTYIPAVIYVTMVI